MRRIARGRMVPQSRSTDPRIGRVSLNAATLYDRMWINSDDQGRLSGDPDEIKYTACPNLPDISKDDIPGLLKELESQELLKVYSTSRYIAIQMLDWWEEQKLQWAYPSPYAPPEGWTDHLRYHSSPKEIITVSWPPPVLPSTLPSELPSTLPSNLRESTKENTDKDIEEEKEIEEEEGRLPSTLGSKLPSKSSPSSPTLEFFTQSFQKAWGRNPNTREVAQLRDLDKKIYAAGGATPKQVHDAFKEAAMQNKLHISYVRAILLDWLGIERSRSP